MRSELAFEMGRKNRGKPLMVFNWDQAAKLIVERKPKVASAGLRDDWENTGGCIYKDGQAYKKDYTYLASTWAIPELDLDGEKMPCYTTYTAWDAETKWPLSALKILQRG
jgi:hypothetical protein